MSVPPYETKAEPFRALGHPIRIRVLGPLRERDHAVREPLAQIATDPSGPSQQLATLRRTGLVRQQRIGGEVGYSLVVPEPRGLVLAAPPVLLEVLSDQERPERELEPTDGTAQ